MLGLIPRDYWQHSLADFLRGVAAILRPMSLNDTLDIPGVGRSIPLCTGRAAMVAALRTLDLPPGARIGVPLYCCSVVFDAIVAAGYTVRFIDVTPTTFCMSPEDLAGKSHEVDAIIAVHMFGNACDVATLRAAAPGKPVIEDCAQALGTLMHGRPAGSFGEAAVFSFRSGKYISAGEGGSVRASSSKLSTRILDLVAGMPAPGTRSECMHVAKCYAKSKLRSRPLYGVIGYRLWNRYNRKREDSRSPNVHLKRIFRSDFAITVRRFRSLDLSVQRQRQIADSYLRKLACDSRMLCFEPPQAAYNRYLFPVTFASQAVRNRMASQLLQKEIDSMRYLDEIVSVARTRFGYLGDCPVAERLSQCVLVIPSHHGLQQHCVERIVDEFNRAWAVIGNDLQMESLGVSAVTAINS